MSPAQYCARFGIAESTLRGWLKIGLMEDAEKNDGVWDIPEDARTRYEPRKKKNRTQDDNRWDLLKALKERRYVDEKVLLCQKADLVDLANDLLDKGLIIKSSTPLRRKMEHGIRNLPDRIGRNRIHNEERLHRALEGYIQRNHQRGRGSPAPLIERRRNDQHE